MKKNMRKQLQDLRLKMQEYDIEIYIVSDKDEHLSEYTGAHFCALGEFSGFTGGDGTLAVTPNEAALWTDGRYFIQAEVELKDSGIDLMRMGEKDTPSVNMWIREHLSENGRIGFDGRCTPYLEGVMLAREDRSGLGPLTDTDMCGLVWKNRPEEYVSECWILQEGYCGQSAGEKLSMVRRAMSLAGAAVHVIASLDDIAWITNLRADDIPCNPVFSAYMIIKKDTAFLYSDRRHFNSEVTAYLTDIGIEIRDKDSVFEDTANCEGPVLLDRKRCSYELVNRLKAGTRIIDRLNPAMTAKCRKNAVETENIRLAQHMDSLAVTRFIYWFKNTVFCEGEASNKKVRNASDAASALFNEEHKEGQRYITEWDCVRKLHELRCECGKGHFIGESFNTISAYGPNAAMAHYMPSENAEVPIEPHGFYLVDSGGQYYEGTTDITRTLGCGELTDRERRAFTLTLCANLRLAAAVFPSGCSNLVLDYAAREPFWKYGMNYNHGTGHGVGYLLNVHEAPVGIRYKASTQEGIYPLEEGMYLSDEPGFYQQGSFGVRLENLLLVKKMYENEYGSFLSFETCTLVPFDTSCIEPSLMTAEDIRLLNSYHERVYRELSADLNERERKWLEMQCRPVAFELYSC